MDECYFESGSAYRFTKQKTVLPLSPPRPVWTTWHNDDDGGVFAGEAVAIILHLDSFSVAGDPPRDVQTNRDGKRRVMHYHPEDYNTAESLTETDEYCVSSYLVISANGDSAEWGGPIDCVKAIDVFGTAELAEKAVADDIASWKAEQARKAAEATKGTTAEAGTGATSSTASEQHNTEAP